MSEEDRFSLVIVSPDEILFEGEVSKLVVPGLLQDLAILPHHTPLYAQLSKGTVTTYQLNGTVKSLEVDSGIIRVKNNRVSVLIGFDTRENIFKA